MEYLAKLMFANKQLVDGIQAMLDLGWALDHVITVSDGHVVCVFSKRKTTI
jgi:hypothetical protein